MNDPILMGLETARARIEREADWLKRRAALTIDGYEVSPNNPSACRFCLAGAIVSAVFNDGGQGMVDACAAYVRTAIMALSPFEWITSFNDAPGTTHVDVLRILDVAIARRREVVNGAVQPA